MAEPLTTSERVQARIRVRGGDSLFFYFSLLLFLASLAAYGGLALLNRAQGEAREELARAVGEKEAELRPELVNQIFLLDARLKNLRTLLSGHLFTSNIFRFLEGSTHPRVRFLSFNFLAQSRRIDMSGEAASYATVAEQVALFERHPHVEKVEFGGLSLGSNNLVNFKLTLMLRDAILRLRP